MSREALKKVSAEIGQAFEREFVGNDRRTRDVPRLDALIAQLASVVEDRDTATADERILLSRMQRERDDILAEMKRSPAKDEEIFVSEPGARVNIYLKLHARAFRTDATRIDLALLDEIIEGLERAAADLRKRTPVSPSRWMVENTEIAANALAVCRQQRHLLEGLLAKPLREAHDDVYEYALDTMVFADSELEAIPERVARGARSRHLLSVLRRLASLPGADWPPTQNLPRCIALHEGRAQAIEAQRKAIGSDKFTELLEAELLELDELFQQRASNPPPSDGDFRDLHHLIERAASVGLHASELYNRTRSKRHDALGIQSRKRLELFVQTEATIFIRRAHARSIH